MGQDSNGWANQQQLAHQAQLQAQSNQGLAQAYPFPPAPPRPDYDAAALVRLAALAKEKENLVAYLGFRVADEDWHGVIDAAGDLRVIEAEMRGLER